MNDPVPDGLLIDRLARGLKPVRRRTPGGDWLMLALLCAIELGLFLGLGFMRPDMSMAMEQPSFWWKSASLGLIALVGGAVAVLSLDPAASPRGGLRWLMTIAACCLLAGWLIDASRDGLPNLAARLNWPDGLLCVMKMVLLSVPAVIGLGLLMRRGAATDAAGTALAAGIAAASWGAFVFVFACPHDDPLYIAVWYAIGCGLVTAFSRWTLPRLTRW
jgi:hypothetical protein